MASEGQRLAAPKEQPLFGIAALRGGELGFDAELAGARITVLEAAVRQTFELARALTALGARLGAQFLFPRQIALQPRRQHRARRQSGGAHERDDVLGLGLRQHLLEIRVRVALLGDGERRADLGAGRTEVEQRLQFLE